MRNLIILSKYDIANIKENLQKAIISKDIESKQFCLRYIANYLELEIKGGMKD